MQSMRKRPMITLLVAGLFLLLPTTSGQSFPANPDPEPEVSTPTTLYFHVFDTFNKFVINTQPMNAEFFEVGGTSFPTFDNHPFGAVLENYDLNTIYGYSTAGPVEYDFIENGKPRFHPEPGIARDVIFDDSVQPMVFMYLDVRDLVGLDAHPNALPTFHMEWTMRTGDDPGDTAKLDAGSLIMSGGLDFHVMDASGWGAHDLICGFTFNCGSNAVLSQIPDDGRFDANPTFEGQSIGGVPILVPDANGVVEVAIPVTFAADKIPKSDAFNIRIDWWQQPDPTGAILEDDSFAEGFVRLFSSPDYLPRLEMNIMNPIYVEFVHPQVAAGTLLIHAGVNSPWGTYDVDADNVFIEIEGPSTPANLEQVVAANTHVHGLHDKAAEITYLWKFRDEGAALGDYTIKFGVSNLAGGYHRVFDEEGNVTRDENGDPIRGEPVHPEGIRWAYEEAGFIIEKERAFGVDEEGNVVEPTVTEGKDTPGFTVIMALLLIVGALFVRRRGGDT